MAKKVSLTPLFLFLCIALSLCQGLSLATEKNAAAEDDSTTSLNTDVQAEYNAMSDKQADWFHWGLIPHPFLHPRHPWPHVHPPLPAGFPKIHWPFVHPPLPPGFPKIHWPFVHPPIPSGGFKFPPLMPWIHPHPWFHHHPWVPPHLWHPHGATESDNINNEGAGDVIDETSTNANPKCSSTSTVVESCMQKSSMSYSWGYTFSPDCCKAIAEVSDECHHTVVSMIKDQCSNKATAPPPTA
ncbi:Uncharacterized protein Adt_34109 [Abeliophyllum distichum]|uniref:Prolamin-like domain-containing protein n=1 Tax=Abeliophyllum distichum TaxID=126358 RepID=A0ABD1QY53_9LAMI